MTMRMAKEENMEKQFEKQMGCMTGFFQIFDRQQIISGKRLCSSKRLLHSKVVDEENDSEMSVLSTPAISREMVKVRETKFSENVKYPAVQEFMLPNPPHRLSVFELKEESRSLRKVTRETPRLSLDSRAIVDSKGSVHPREIHTNSPILKVNRCDSPVASGGGDTDGKQRRSPSVIARLMGLEQLPESIPEYDKARLRRSASESRTAGEYPSVDNAKSSQFLKQTNQSHSHLVVQNLKAAGVNQTKCQFSVDFTRSGQSMEPHSIRNTNGTLEQQKEVNKSFGSSPWKPQQHRKSYFDAADVFPEPKLTMSPYASDIEKKMKARRFDEDSKDLETLKEILEALQFKGLLHSRTPPEHRNFVYDRYLPSECSPIQRSSDSHYHRTLGNDSPLPRSFIRRNLNDKLSSVSHRQDRPHIDSNVRSPAKNRNSSTHNQSNERRNSNSTVKTKPLNIESPRQRNVSIDNRRTSPVHSPRMKSKTDQTGTSKSPRYKRSIAESYQQEKINTEDESSSISESTFSTSSHPDTERSKMEEYLEGKSLLEKCDKLLHSIADMNATEMQPSPMSVLDSSIFDKEDSSSSPSPILKRIIDLKDTSSEFEEEWVNSIIEPDESKLDDTHSQDPDFVYISKILRAYNNLPEDSDLFFILEKQHYFEGKYNYKASILHRRLIFDIITEIIERYRQLPPWKTDSFSKPLLQKIWAEFKRIRLPEASDDIFEIICGVLEKDLASDAVGGCWVDFPVELSAAVLDLERLIFKDLIGETIREIAVYDRRNQITVAYRRKLVF